MTWWDEKASELQRKLIAADYGASQIDDDTAKHAVIHTRQDIALLVSYLSSANRQLSDIKKLLFPIMLLLAVIAYKLN